MNEDKFRHEIKYLISVGQMTVLKQRIGAVMRRDMHTGENGTYNIRSLYFDDYDNRCYYDNVNGVEPREKFRIRIYGHSAERISLECKRKEHGKTLKTSCTITEEQCRELMAGNILTDIKSQPGVLRRLTLEMQMHRMRPVIIVEYDRIPFVSPLGNVRITFDTNISSSRNVGSFLEADIPKRLVMPKGQQLLEVKYDEYLPDQIYRALQTDCLCQTAFSKYVICRDISI